MQAVDALRPGEQIDPYAQWRETLQNILLTEPQLQLLNALGEGEFNFWFVKYVFKDIQQKPTIFWLNF